MLDHQGRKDHLHDENAQVFAELARLAPIIDATRFVASAAILYSDEIGWAWNHAVSTQLRSILARCDISMQGQVLSWYAPLYRKKVGVDILDPLRDLSRYKVVIAPNLYLIHPALVENLCSYVRQGGWLIVGPKAGLKDWHNVFYTDIPPCGGLSGLFGTTVQPAPFRFGRVEMPAKHVTLAGDAPFAPGSIFGHQGVFDNLEPAQARAIACHEDGKVAVTLNSYGQGMAMYVGCQPEEAFYTYVVDWLIHSGKLEPALRTEADVEVTLRAGGGRRLIFVLNHHAGPVQIALEREYRELISDQVVSGALVVDGQGVRILDDTIA